MQVTIGRDAGLAALGRVHSVAASKSTIPALKNALLDAEDGALKLMATDLDAQISETVGCTVDVPGRTTVEAGLLYELFRNFPVGGEVRLTLATADPRLLVQCGRSTYRLPVLPAGDFPVFRSNLLTWSAVFPAPEVRRLLDCTLGYVGREETRPMLMGVRLHAEVRDTARLVAAATDAHRVGTADTAAPESFPPDVGLTVPTKAVQAMQRLLDGVTADIELAGGESLLAMRAGPVELLTKLISYDYPDYQRVIPQANKLELRGRRVDVTQAVKRVALVADRTEKVVAIRFDLDAGRITVSGRNELNGQAVEELDAEYEGPAYAISFNARLLLDVLSSIESVNLRVLLADDPAVAAVFLDDADPHRLFVLAPCRG